ncbi:hypothetical protein EV2_031757 [Malus domestica]
MISLINIKINLFFAIAHRKSATMVHGKQDANRAVFHKRIEYFIKVHTLYLAIDLKKEHLVNHGLSQLSPCL